MCLELKKIHWRHTARRDIKVWKLLILNYDSSYCTPFQRFNVKEGNLYKSEFVKCGNIVFDGIHSFTSEKDVRLFAEIKMRYRFEHYIAECTIPRGARYYKGIFNYGSKLKSIASSELRYDRIYKP